MTKQEYDELKQRIALRIRCIINKDSHLFDDAIQECILKTYEIKQSGKKVNQAYLSKMWYTTAIDMHRKEAPNNKAKANAAVHNKLIREELRHYDPTHLEDLLDIMQHCEPWVEDYLTTPITQRQACKQHDLLKPQTHYKDYDMIEEYARKAVED